MSLWVLSITGVVFLVGSQKLVKCSCHMPIITMNKLLHWIEGHYVVSSRTRETFTFHVWNIPELSRQFVTKQMKIIYYYSLTSGYFKNFSINRINWKPVILQEVMIKVGTKERVESFHFIADWDSNLLATTTFLKLRRRKKSIYCKFFNERDTKMRGRDLTLYLIQMVYLLTLSPLVSTSLHFSQVWPLITSLPTFCKRTKQILQNKFEVLVKRVTVKNCDIFTSNPVKSGTIPWGSIIISLVPFTWRQVSSFSWVSVVTGAILMLEPYLAYLPSWYVLTIPVEINDKSLMNVRRLQKQVEEETFGTHKWKRYF